MKAGGSPVESESAPADSRCRREQGQVPDPGCALGPTPPSWTSFIVKPKPIEMPSQVLVLSCEPSLRMSESWRICFSTVPISAQYDGLMAKIAFFTSVTNSLVSSTPPMSPAFADLWSGARSSVTWALWIVRVIVAPPAGTVSLIVPAVPEVHLLPTIELLSKTTLADLMSVGSDSSSGVTGQQSFPSNAGGAMRSPPP